MIARKTQSRFLFTLSLAVAYLITPALAQPSPPTLTFFDEITHGGTGCPQETTVEAEIGTDGQSVHIMFEDYQVDVSSETNPIAQKTCTISLPLSLPAGWQYAVATIEYHNALSLTDGVAARRRAEVFFQGSEGIEFVNQYQGFAAHDYTLNLRVDLEPDRRVWSRCNTQRNLNVQTGIRSNNTDNRTSTGRFGERSPTIYTLVFRQCE